MLTFQLNFVLEVILSLIFCLVSNTESREVSLNENVYDFSVDYNSTHKSSDILNIHNYLTTKNNIK